MLHCPPRLRSQARFTSMAPHATPVAIHRVPYLQVSVTLRSDSAADCSTNPKPSAIMVTVTAERCRRVIAISSEVDTRFADPSFCNWAEAALAYTGTPRTASRLGVLRSAPLSARSAPPGRFGDGGGVARPRRLPHTVHPTRSGRIADSSRYSRIQTIRHRHPLHMSNAFDHQIAQLRAQRPRSSDLPTQARERLRLVCCSSWRMREPAEKEASGESPPSNDHLPDSCSSEETWVSPG